MTDPARRHPNTNSQRLDALVQSIEDLRRDFDAYKARSKTAILLLKEHNNELRVELQGAQARIGFLEGVLDIQEESAAEGEGSTGGNGGEAAQAAGGGPQGGELAGAAPPPGPEAGEDAAAVRAKEAAAAISQQHVDGKVMKVSIVPLGLVYRSDSPGDQDMIRAVLCKKLGIPQLFQQYLPPYPTCPVNSNEWPTDAATNEKLTRFDWYASSNGTDPTNLPTLCEVKDAIRTLGPGEVPDSTPILPAVLDAHLMKRLHTKFNYLAGQYKIAHPQAKAARPPTRKRKLPRRAADQGGDEDEDGSLGGDEDEEDLDEGENEDGAEPDGGGEEVEVKLERGVGRSRAKKVRTYGMFDLMCCRPGN